MRKTSAGDRWIPVWVSEHIALFKCEDVRTVSYGEIGSSNQCLHSCVGERTSHAQVHPLTQTDLASVSTDRKKERKKLRLDYVQG